MRSSQLSPSMAVKSIKMLACAALVMAVPLCGPAIAQDQSAQSGVMVSGMMNPGMMSPATMGMMGPGMMAGASGPAMCSAMAGHIDGRLAYVKAELKITDTQEIAVEQLRGRRTRQRKYHARTMHDHDGSAQRVVGKPARSPRSNRAAYGRAP